MPAPPPRPRLARFAERALPPLWDRRLLPPPDLRLETLVDHATRSTGLHDFGNAQALFANLAVLLPAMREEARLNAWGRLIGHGSMLKLLRERLWAQAIFTAHPEIDAITLAPPIVVVGPMRSGTTRIQRLLACDPRFTALTLFEAMCPVPWPTSRRAAEGGRRDPREAYTARGLSTLYWLNPANAAVHPTSATTVDEELGLLEQSATGAQVEAQRRVPSFRAHAEAADQRPAYAHMRRLLKLRAWWTGTDPARPYVLKTPQHMQDLPALLDTFPDARLVFTHRDPVSVVASSASLAWNQMVVQSDHVDPAWVGAEWLHKTRHRMLVTARTRAERAPPAIDVTYAEADRDWRGTVARIYAHLGLDLPPATLAAMAAYLDHAERAHPHRAHRYAPEDFGLSAGAIREALHGIAG